MLSPQNIAPRQNRDGILRSPDLKPCTTAIRRSVRFNYRHLPGDDLPSIADTIAKTAPKAIAAFGAAVEGWTPAFAGVI
jgi:hypothetical protein